MVRYPDRIRAEGEEVDVTWPGDIDPWSSISDVEDVLEMLASRIEQLEEELRLTRTEEER